MHATSGEQMPGRGVSASRLAALDAGRLEALLESTQLLSSSVGLEDLLGHLLRTVMGRLLAGRGFVALQEAGAYRLVHVRGLKMLAPGGDFDEERARAAGVDTLFPIGGPERPKGLLGVARPAAREIDDGELVFVDALLSIAASAIDRARAHAETQRLNQVLGLTVQELRALLDLARGLNGCLDPDQAAQLLGLTLSGRWAVSRYLIAARREGHPVVLRQKGIALAAWQELLAEVSTLPDAARADDLPAGNLRDVLLAQKGVLVFPLRSSDQTIGMVIVGQRPGKLKYSGPDLEFGIGMAAQAVVALENAWNLRETLEKRRMEEELALAASIQEKLFPAELPALEGCEVAALNRPALECGGDHYDVMTLPDGADGRRFLLCVADVSGKGLPASLLMSNMQAMLHASAAYRPTLLELTTRTDALIYASTPTNKYITAILIHFDPTTGKGRYVNAGHDGALIVRAEGDTQPLEATGPPLGLIPEMTFSEGGFELSAGDVLLLYSDGVPEAVNIHREQWGHERLRECMRRCRTRSAAEIIAGLLQEIDAFVGEAPPHDDITLLVVKRLA